MTTRLSKADRSRRTRRALLDVGQALFADVGYARTTTGELVRRAGVTRGALYYHFPDKTALFLRHHFHPRSAGHAVEAHLGQG